MFSAVVVTRGDVKLDKVIASIQPHTDDLIIWDNSSTKYYDAKVFGRYLGAWLGKYDKIYTQDDDCIVDVGKIMKSYKPGVIVNNIPEWKQKEYTGDITLVGWGSVFDKKLMNVFNKYVGCYEMDDLFLKECDRIFTGMNKHKSIDIGIDHLRHHSDETRMYQRKTHFDDLTEIIQRISTVLKNMV